MSIKVSNLLKVYGEQKAVNNLSFEISKGEIVGFLGPNGAGKSTTMKILTGYLEQDGGEATVCDINVRSNPIAAKQKVGYLPEANPLYFDMYVREYLGFVADVHEVKNKKQRIEDVINMVGLTPESKKKVGQLSKGYKQRVGLAAALMHDPEVLILDEPTSGLDPNQIIEIRNVIKQQGQNKTILFSSHILQEVEAMCDRVIIINKGNMVADDKVSGLQSQMNNNIIRVSFKENVSAEWLQNLSQVQSLTSVDPFTWDIVTENVDAAKKQLMQLSLDKNLNIASLNSEGQSLEDVFRQLTN